MKNNFELFYLAPEGEWFYSTKEATADGYGVEDLIEVVRASDIRNATALDIVSWAGVIKKNPKSLFKGKKKPQERS